jgi:hypothetical protein
MAKNRIDPIVCTEPERSSDVSFRQAPEYFDADPVLCSNPPRMKTRNHDVGLAADGARQSSALLLAASKVNSVELHSDGPWRSVRVEPRRLKNRQN